jgi:hypothetical protein
MQRTVSNAPEQWSWFLRALCEGMALTHEIVAQDVPMEVDGSGLMTAYLARPAGAGDHPAVLVGSELWGVTEDV